MVCRPNRAMRYGRRGRRGWAALLGVFLMAVGLGGCDGDGNPEDPSGTGANGTDAATNQTLRFAGLEALDDYMRRAEDDTAPGVGMGDTEDGTDTVSAPEFGAPGADAGEGAAAGGNDGDHRSDVNVQERGVDEADLMRSDGTVIYAIEQHGRIAPPGRLDPRPEGPAIEPAPGVPEGSEGDSSSEPSRVRMMAIGDPATELTAIGALVPTSETDARVDLMGLYLANAGEDLVILGAGRSDPWSAWYEPGYWASEETLVWFADVRDPDNATLERPMRFEGGLVDSRRVGDVLYLATRYYPPLEEVQDGAPSRVVPRQRRDDQDWEPLAVEGCFVENMDRARDRGLITLIAVDLADPAHPHQSTCFAGEAQTLYSSTEALYLAAPDWRPQERLVADGGVAEFSERTLVHKFAFEGLELTYRGSGLVPGRLADSPREAAFRFSEQGNHLRVVTEARQFPNWFQPTDGPVAVADDIPPESDDTTRVGPGEPTTNEATPIASPVLLTILRDADGREDLETIATLPNPDRPQAIGLRGETLYATRYVGDMAYVVTFRQTDPLYVIDLSDPADPYIRGELKIEGFSDYLHPVGNDLLIGIGKHAIPDPEGEFRGAWLQGVQITLLNVSDPANPTEMDRLIVGERGTEASVLADHLAFAARPTAERTRFALTLNVYDAPGFVFDPERPWANPPFAHHGLYRFEVDPVDQRLVRRDPLITGNAFPSGRRLRNDRALLIDEAVHLYHDGRFWSQDWGGEGAIRRPSE